MGIFCMVLGVIVVIAFLLVGHCAGTMMLMEGFLGLLGGSASLGISDLLKFPAAENLGTYLKWVGGFGFLGLLFGLLLFMLGMIYRRMDRVEYYARKAGSRKNKD